MQVVLMDYENERWMKVYTRDTGGWLDLSWQARGLALELARKLDATGRLPLGKKGLPSLAGVLRGRWEEMRPFVEELLADGRLVLEEGNVLHDPEHEVRQSARSSATSRKKAQRDREALSRDVTRRHAESHDVTIRHDQIRSDQIRRDQIRSDISRGASPDPKAEPFTKTPMEPVVEEITRVIQRRKPETACPTSEADAAEVSGWAKRWLLPEEHAEFTGFLDHHRKSDARFRDWSAAWRTWLRNAAKFAGTRQLFGGARHVQSGDNRAWKLPPEMP